MHKIKPDGTSGNTGWININEYIKIFERDKLKLNGMPYDVHDPNRKEELEDAIIGNAGILHTWGLLEKKISNHPVRLEYKVTKRGRKLDSLRGSKFREFRCKVFFFRKALIFKINKYKWIVSAGAFFWAVVNAVRFYSLALTWMTELSVLMITTLLSMGIVLYVLFKRYD
ncbi:MAG: hypothetical protein ACUZ8E_12650 [Candidatus Anammoxibacter sp.]